MDSFNTPEYDFYFVNMLLYNLINVIYYEIRILTVDNDQAGDLKSSLGLVNFQRRAFPKYLPMHINAKETA